MDRPKNRTALAGPAFLGVLLAGCGEQPPSAPPPALAPSEPSASVAPVAADGAMPGYVGRWAARPELCQTGAWNFDERRVATAGEVFCEFEGVRPVGDSYEIAATCVTQAPPEPQRFTLAMRGRDRLVVTGGPWAGPIGLTRCAP